MDIEAINGAGMVALGCTLIFLLVAKSWGAISRVLGDGASFPDTIMHEAAERLREELQRLSVSQSIYLGGVLVFVMLFLAAHTLEARRLFAGYPDWQLHLQFLFLLLATTFILCELGVTIVKRRQLRFRTLANIAVGHRLQQISSDSTQVFHDVATSAGVIDHLVISRTGLYAVNVICRRVSGTANVSLEDNTLVFSDTASKQPIDNLVRMIEALEREFEALLGYKVRIRSVVAVPGWEATSQASARHLLVNEKNVAMLTGWKTHADQLMHDDVDRLQELMTARCLRAGGPDSRQLATPRGSLPPR